ncbi:MAG: ABC transporter ATP-binding protein [Actinomycetes bacterium]
MSLIIDNISFSYGDRPILSGLSLEVPTGTTTAVVAPSGSGKSTLLRIIAGLLTPSTGSIILDGQDLSHVPTHLRSVGMVFQDNQLFPHLNVYDNVMFGLRMAKTEKTIAAKRCHDLLELVGLSQAAKQSVATLSGGESKRVALARALAPSPRLLLLDEPLTGLDNELHDRLAHDLQRILHATSTTALLVTHSLPEAEIISDSLHRLPKAVDSVQDGEKK